MDEGRMAADTTRELPPWDKNNPEEKQVLRVSEDEDTRDLCNLLVRGRPRLIEIINPSALWAHLRSLGVLDAIQLEEITFNAPPHRQVERLLDHLERGPTWCVHALLRACALTNQKHVIRDLGLNPLIYRATDGETLGSSQGSSSSTTEVRLSGPLLRAIRDHSRACQQKLMRTKLFDFDSDPKAEVLDISEYFIQVDLKANQTTRRNRGQLHAIPEGHILNRFAIGDTFIDPQVTRLDGATGAGKTTFLKHLVHKWSNEFQNLQGEPVIMDVQDGQYSTMVYLHVRSIKGSVREAIRSALWCRQEDKDVLMNHIETGEGVVVLIDAIDELRDETIINELRAYVDSQMGNSQKLLISSRTDLCRIDPEKFDRVLVLQGFTLPQAMNYVKSYFPSGPTPSQPQPTLTYINNHQQDLEPILTNPLQIHILCELISRGLLELRPDEHLDILKLFQPLEKHLVRRELEKRHRDGSAKGRDVVTEEDAEQFYRLCLYGILTGLREFSESHLQDFHINNVYLCSFLTQHVEMGLDATSENFYRFQHEMLYEYFAACFFHTASEDSLKPLILAVCGQKCLRNVQKIICEILSGKEMHNEDLLQSVIRVILMLQHEGETTKYQREQHRMQDFKSEHSVANMLLYIQNEQDIKKARETWDTINWSFDSDAFASELRSEHWFQNLDDNGTIQHIVDCLQSCPPHQQEEVIRHTVHFLLPCTYTNQDGGETTVYEAGLTRWGQVSRLSDGQISEVLAWCPEDALDILQANSGTVRNSEDQSGPLVNCQSTGTSSPVSAGDLPVLSMQVTNSPDRSSESSEFLVPEDNWGSWVTMSLHHYHDLWAEPPASCWSQQAWESLLQLIPNRERGEEMEIRVPETASLSGLLACPPPTQLAGEGHVEVYYGRGRLEEVEDWATRWQHRGGLLLKGPVIVLPIGPSKGLERRVNKLRAMRNSQGRQMVDHASFVTFRIHV